ncbi:TPA: hypothetical protein U1C85_000753 [Streptococcus suis]|nr:hypothetical protein [Streptococcus suis]
MKKKMPNRSHFWGNSAYFLKILNGIFLLEIEAGILEFILVIGVLIMFFLGVGKRTLFATVVMVRFGV